MMNSINPPQFAAVTYVKGSQDAISARLDQAMEASLALTARMDGNPGVIIDGDDVVTFLKKEANIDVPPELMEVSADEAKSMIMNNMEKYGVFVEALQELASDVFGFIGKVFSYAEAHKEAGKPVNEINV